MPNYIHYKDKPEKIQEINKNYYDSHRDKIIEHMTTKVTCKCGKVLCAGAMSKHRKSKTHQMILGITSEQLTQNKETKVSSQGSGGASPPLVKLPF